MPAVRTMEGQEMPTAFSIDVAHLGPALALILAFFHVSNTVCSNRALFSCAG